MKKIMFNDRYGLTKAVMEGRKTMTRRIIKAPKTMEGQWVSGFAICKRPGSDEVVEVMALDADDGMINNILPKYKPGEVVAVAQSYNDSGWNPNTLQQTFVKEPTVFPDLDPITPLFGWIDLPLKYHKGWSNKMFVYAGLMPHQIRITNVRVERLQDISDEDALREGVYMRTEPHPRQEWEPEYTFGGGKYHAKTPVAAFAALIDNISGKGTWEANPWVYAYEFELVKQEQPDTDGLYLDLADFLTQNDVPEEKAKFLANRISDEYGSKKYLEGLCDGIKQEQPKVDLEKEIETYFKGWYVDETDQGYILHTSDDHAGLMSVKQVARHFCEFGLRRAAEMYDEIEYNRQRAEEEPDKSLEEAVEKHINEALFKWSYDDEDGIEQYVHDSFIAGAEWQKSQMLKDAVGGTVHHALNCHYIMTDQQALNDRLREIPEGTVVNIFICKAKEEQL